jgi:3-dehydroquinate synthase
VNEITKVPVELDDRSYEILIAPGILSEAGKILSDFAGARRCLLVTDSNVRPLYGESVRESLASAGAEVCEHVFEAGEEHKTPATITDICRKGVRCGLDRKSLIAALGGGVCGDMAGFSAAVYMRGIEFVQIPTTLLAMVDSSVGGKTGVDLPEGKNLMGAFWQPKLVLIDPEVLKSLPEKEIRCGLAEVIKYGVIMDAELFADLEKNVDKLKSLDMEYYTGIVARCCELKAEVVRQDEREGGLRAILNYGHTFGHAVEMLSDFTISHGEAVAMGMVMAAELAVITGRISREDAERQNRLLTALGLPTRVPAGFEAEKIYSAMQKDKKKVGSMLKLVLPDEIGKVSIVGDSEINDILKAIGVYCD